MNLHLYCFLTLGLVTTFQQTSEPIGPKSLDMFCKMVYADPGIATRLAPDEKPFNRKTSLPRIVRTKTTICPDPSKPDKIIEITGDLEQLPFAGRLINLATNDSIAKGGYINRQTVSFLGLFDLGTYALSGTTIKLRPLGGILPIGPTMEKSVEMKLSTGLTRLEGNLDKLSQPRLNDHWTLEISTTTRVGKTTINSDQHMEFSVKESVSASTICSTLTGNALMVNCEGKLQNGKTFLRRFAYFEDYQWYFQTEEQSDGGKYVTKISILSVEP